MTSTSIRSAIFIEIDRMRLGALRRKLCPGVLVAYGEIEIDRMRLGALRQYLALRYSSFVPGGIEIDRMRLGALRRGYRKNSKVR